VGCKKVDLSSTQSALCTVSVFFILHFTHLGGAYTHPTHSPAYGLGGQIVWRVVSQISTFPSFWENHAALGREKFSA